MRFNRTKWAGVAALALVGGLLAPVITAPGAQAATINVTDASCLTPFNFKNLSGDPGDVVSISANLTGCTSLGVEQVLVDDSSAILAVGGNITISGGNRGGDPYWEVTTDDSFTQVTVTLTNTSGASGTLVVEGAGTNFTDWTVTISGSAPNPPTPTPTPATPPSAPASAEATAGNGEVTVSWTAPASQGSFPITNYQVQSTTGNLGCLVPVTATSCRVAGLRNGTEYTFRVRALNGGGWGSWAMTESVTPRPNPDPEASIMITGTRSANDRVARVKGETTGLTGATLQAMVRLSTQTEFAPGSSRQVDAQGGFTWQRRTPATVSVEVYFTAGDISSNTVTIASV